MCPGQIPQLPGLRSIQRRQQHPMAHALCLPAQRFHPAHGQCRRQNINGLWPVGIGNGIGHNQPVLGPGHGHIQHPHFFADGLLPDPVRNGQLAQRGIADTLDGIRHLHAQAQLLVTQHLFPRVGHIEFMGQIGEHHNRKLQALGLVDAHNRDCFRVLSRRPGKAPLRQPVQMLQKTLQRTHLSLLKIRSQTVELPQILLGRLPAGHHRIDIVNAGFGKDQLQQLRQSPHACGGTQPGQEGQEGSRFVILPLRQRIKEPFPPGPRPEPGQVLGRKSEEGACQTGKQRNVLSGIGNGLQKALQHLNFRALKNVRPGIRTAADAPGLQRLPEQLAPGAGGAQKNHDISGLHGPQSCFIPDRRLLPQHSGDSVRREGRLRGLTVRGPGQKPQLHGGIRQCFPGHALPESLLISIVQTANVFCHAPAEHIVHRVQNLRTGPEVLTQQHSPAMAGPSVFRAFVGIVFFQKNTGVRLAELINGLLHVAHQKAVFLLPGQAVENGILNAVGILILIHQHLPEPPPNLYGHRRRRCPVRPQ